MVCKKCGSEMTEGSRFCMKCGAKVEEIVITEAAPVDVSHARAVVPPPAVAMKMAPPPPGPAAGKPIMKNISPAVQAAVSGVIKTKTIAGRFQFREFRMLLEETGNADAAVDAMRKKYSTRSIIFGVVSFLLMFGGIALLANGMVAPGLLVFAGIAVTIIMFIISISKMVHFNRMDLTNEFRQTIVPLLEVLSEDVDPKSKVRVKMDLSGVAKAKLKDTKKVPKAELPPRVLGIRISTFYDPWCRIDVELINGNVLILEMENTLIEFKRTRRNPRGKIKTKSKWKKLTIVTAALDPDSASFAWDDTLVQTHKGDGKLKTAVRGAERIMKIEKKFKFKNPEMESGGTGRDPVPHYVEPKQVFGMFLELLSMLNATKTGS